MKVLMATHNKHKRREIKFLLKGFKNVKVLNLSDLKTQMPTIVEDGKSFRQNAVKKAVTISKFYDGLVLADDSGLEVDALYGRPGVRSARFARAKATDEENVNKLLKLMQQVPEHKRKACFVCCIALSENGVLLGSYQGAVKGSILFETRGDNGFGYDPVFLPEGYEKTFAEMEGALKNKISHRAIALDKFKKAISKIVGPEDAVQQELELMIEPVMKSDSRSSSKIKKIKPKAKTAKAVAAVNKTNKKKTLTKTIAKGNTSEKKALTSRKKTASKKETSKKGTSGLKKKAVTKSPGKKTKTIVKKAASKTKKPARPKIKSRKK